MSREIQESLRKLPAVDEILRQPEIAALLEVNPKALLLEAVRTAVDELRNRILKEKTVPDPVAVDPKRVSELCVELRSSHLKNVINLTGVVVHTNMGRSPLSAEVLERMAKLASGYSNLEYDLGAGGRGSRHVHAQARLMRLLDVEDAVVVNNNAAAVLLSLAALAEDKEVVVSRGELVEIGGSFRIPDVMRQSGARLKEVGTTNRTRIKDYADAINDQTGLLLKVHRSNFAVTGFVEEVEPEELGRLGKERGVPTMMDLGSGCLHKAYAGFPHGPFPEPGARELLKTGLDVISFSGDKLLGGPQAGIIAGKGKLVAAIRSHPLMRTVRPGKLTLAALDAVLDLYQWGSAEKLPTVSMICARPEELEKRRDDLLGRLRKEAPDHVALTPVNPVGRVGGGAMPLLELPSAGIAVTSKKWSADELEALLRASTPPVLTRVHKDTVVIDVRTLAPDELEPVAAAFATLRKKGA